MKGEIHFNVPVKAGDTVLQPGMYQLQHVIEGNDHVVIFKSVEMPAAIGTATRPSARKSVRGSTARWLRPTRYTRPTFKIMRILNGFFFQFARCDIRARLAR